MADSYRSGEETLTRASKFMMESVAYRGGFVMIYSEDLTRRWGELVARDTMIWVQDPATVGVGELMLRAYRITKDPFYLESTKTVASALIYGQHPSGGWHYFIDFDPTGTAGWYERVGTKAWGWEEFYYNYGNCTFDDSVTVEATRFLLNLYLETGDPAYRPPLEKALNFILEAQYPNGAWPQRFPLQEGMGYTGYYTYNDDIILGNIEFLLEAHRKLGDDRYRDAAIRGMNFVLLSQLPEPTAGWAQQYDLDMKPAAARSYEPAALSTLDTVQNIRALGDFFLETGDRRYLDAIPPAIEWLEGATIPKEQSTTGHTHATFIDLKSNRPLYGHREGTSMETGRYWNDENPENLLRGYGYTFNLDPDSMWKRYHEFSEMDSDERISALENLYLDSPRRNAPPSEEIEGLVDSIDERGAWLEDIEIPDLKDYMNNPPERLRGIRTATFLKNSHQLLDYLEVKETEIGN